MFIFDRINTKVDPWFVSFVRLYGKKNCIFYVSSIEFPKSSIAKSSEAIHIERYITRYRTLYILNNDFNLIAGRMLLPFLKLILILVFSLSFFSIARLFKDLEVLALVVVSSLSVMTCLYLAPIAIATSRIFDLSSQFCFKFSSKVNLVTEIRSKRILQRQLRSCPLIRCQLGGLYHMEAKAKLTMVHNMLNFVAFLLVNFK